MIRQRAAYDALAARLELADLDLLIGVPTAIHRTPAAWVTSTVIEVPPERTFAAPLRSRLRPTLTLAVSWQDQHEAEWQIVDLVDQVLAILWAEPLEDVCTARIETVTYDWRSIGGIDYRIADLSLVLSQL
jgi:hypothetical protein